MIRIVTKTQIVNPSQLCFYYMTMGSFFFDCVLKSASLNFHHDGLFLKNVILIISLNFRDFGAIGGISDVRKSRLQNSVQTIRVYTSTS
jgi:hypothetical protein